MSFLSLDRSQNDSRLTIFLTKGKRVFHLSILYLVCLGNVYASDRLSYRQAFMYRPRHTYYITVVVFVCSYVLTYVRTYVRTYGMSIRLQDFVQDNRK